MQHDKIGFYLDVSRTVQKLKQCGSKTRLDDEGDDGLLSMLWRLQKLLGESTNEINVAGLRPFSRLRMLQSDLQALYQTLNEGLDGENSCAQDTTLGRDRHRELQDLIGQFERVFREEVESRIVFISPDRSGLLEYASRNEFLHSDMDKQHYQYLPRMAQEGLENAGQCLIYGLPSAAITMSLQAVEATIRYYYLRHGGPPRGSLPIPEWGGMIDWLNRQQPSLLPGNEVDRRRCHAMLDRLRHSYRNTVAHGRALPEEYAAKSEEIFRECLTAALILAGETSRRPQLRLRIIANPDLDFDSAVATYLFSWNPEFPPLPPDMVRFNETLGKGEIIDETVVPTSHWPRQICATATESLSHVVRRCFRPQPNYAATIDPLISFVDECRQGAVTSHFDHKLPREDAANLNDLFVGIHHQANGQPQQVLTETWRMLDRFVGSFLPANDPNFNLVSELGMDTAYSALCRMPPSVSSNR